MDDVDRLSRRISGTSAKIVNALFFEGYLREGALCECGPTVTRVLVEDALRPLGVNAGCFRPGLKNIPMSVLSRVGVGFFGRTARDAEFQPFTQEDPPDPCTAPAHLVLVGTQRPESCLQCGMLHGGDIHYKTVDQFDVTKGPGYDE